MSATGIELTGPRCSPTSEMSAPSAVSRIAVNAATVNEDISERKKFIAPVTVPIWARATEFCSDTTLIGKVVPRPSEKIDSSTNSPHSGSGRNGSSALRAYQTKLHASATDAPVIARIVGDSQR